MRRVLAVVGLLAGSAVLVAPAHAGGGCHGSGQPTGDGTTVQLSMNCMTPRVLRAAEGSEITFVNRDQVGHNLVGDEWGVGELNSGDSHKRTFPVGTHVYSCTLHPGMVGAVVVGAGEGVALADATPIAASADEGGSSAWLLAGVAGLVLGSGATLGARRLRASTA